MTTRRRLILGGVDVFHHNRTTAIDKVPVKVGGMLLLLFADLEIPDRGIMSLASGGNRRDADKLPASVVIEFLLTDIDHDMGRARG